MTDDEVASALALLALAYRSACRRGTCWMRWQQGPRGRPDRLRQVATALRWGATEAEAWDSVGPPWAAAARALAVAHSAECRRARSCSRPPTTSEQPGWNGSRCGGEGRRAARGSLGLVLLPAFCLTTVVPLVLALAGDLLRP